MLKTKVLDPVGEFSLGIPNTETQVSRDGQQYHGSLVYQLSEGHAVVEVWL